MSEIEFEAGASAAAQGLLRRPLEERIAAACRGSGNPAALAWLAESLQLHADTSVIDLGAGLGGPAAWLTLRYGCWVVVADPASASAAGAAMLFGLPTVQSSADASPFPAETFDVALLFGVVSVVDDPAAALVDARRVAGRLGLIDYCSIGSDVVCAGGSRFTPFATLTRAVERAGWTVEQEAQLSVPAPDAWSAAAGSVEVTGGDAEESEREVIDAIHDGRLAPFMLTARR